MTCGRHEVRGAFYDPYGVPVPPEPGKTDSSVSSHSYVEICGLFWFIFH